MTSEERQDIARDLDLSAERLREKALDYERMLPRSDFPGADAVWVAAVAASIAGLAELAGLCRRDAAQLRNQQ